MLTWHNVDEEREEQSFMGMKPVHNVSNTWEPWKLGHETPTETCLTAQGWAWFNHGAIHALCIGAPFNPFTLTCLTRCPSGYYGLSIHTRGGAGVVPGITLQPCAPCKVD